MERNLLLNFTLAHGKRWHTRICFVMALLLSSVMAHAQLGSNWALYSPTKKIHLDNEAGLQIFDWTSYKSVCSNPICADYRYDAATNTETFQIFDSRSNRSEIRLINEYSTGSRQFEGYVTITAPLEDESLFQIFGSTSGATQLMIRGFASNNGTISGGGASISNIYDKEVRVNVIHLQENVGNKFIIYFNGVKAGELADNEAVTNYQKYGCYGTTNGNVPARVKWRAVRVFRDGTAPSGTPTAPSAPSALAASAVSQSQINLTWSDNSSNESNFQVERSTNGGTSWSALVTLGANVESYSNTGLSAGTTYHYRVRATNATGNSGYSNIANATTQSTPIQPTYQAEDATISGGVVESNHLGFNGTGFVNYDNIAGSYVQWTINVASAGVYNLAIRNANGGTMNRPMSITVNGTQTHASINFNPTGAWATWVSTPFTASLNAGLNTLRATATTIDGGPNVDQLEVNGIAVSPPAAPGSLTANAPNMNQINLVWADNSSNETQFRIERSTNAGSTWSFLANVGANVTSYSNTGLTAGTTYHYRVRAENAGGNSAFSNIANATTQSPPVVTNVALNKPVTASSSDINVPANAVDGNTATRWSASPMPQWLEVDLGSLYTINRTEVICYLDRAYQFRVEVKSTATGAYTQVVDRTTNTTPGTIAAPIANNFTAIDARYVRISVTGASGYTGTWASLLEFRVFGFASGAASMEASSAPEETSFLRTAEVSETVVEKVAIETYPNPGTAQVAVRYSVKKEGKVSLYLHNGAAHKTLTLVNEHKLPGVYEIAVDVSPLPNGIHVFRLLVDGKSHVNKFIKK